MRRVEERRHEKRNFACLVASQAAFGLGWLFKTESLVVSSAASALGASGTELGLFPAASRLGRFLPQMLFARMLATRKRRLPVLIVARLIFACFWVMIGLLVWTRGLPGARGILWTFFAVYTVSMFSRSGAIAANASLRGKLIRSDLRGRLVGVRQFLDGLVRTFVSLLIVTPLLAGAKDPRLYGIAFLVSGVIMGASVVPAFFIREHEGEPQKGRSLASYARKSLKLLREDDFRKAVYVRLIIGMALAMHPFYMRYGKESCGADWERMLGWMLAAQALSRAVGGAVMGALADRFGNRLVIRMVSLLVVLRPLYALFAGKAAVAHPWVYVSVYALLGLILPGMPVTGNYILELSTPERQPDYIGALNTCLMLNVLAAPVAGIAADIFGYEALLVALAVAALPGVWVSLRLREPRERLRVKIESPLA